MISGLLWWRIASFKASMGALDELVLQHVRAALLTSEKANALLDPLRTRQEKAEEDQVERLAARNAEVQAAKKSLDALYDMIRHGVVDLAEEDFKQRFLSAKEHHLRAQKNRDQVAAELAPEARVSHQKVSAFVSGIQEALAQPSIAGKRGFLRAITDGIKVGADQITILGRRSQFERAIVSGEAIDSTVSAFVRKWRGDRDSNPGTALTVNGFQDRRIRPLCHLPNHTSWCLGGSLAACKVNP